jgi:hypothetical protein
MEDRNQLLKLCSVDRSAWPDPPTRIVDQRMRFPAT